jgi:hypothetical protein
LYRVRKKKKQRKRRAQEEKRRRRGGEGERKRKKAAGTRERIHTHRNGRTGNFHFSSIVEVGKGGTRGKKYGKGINKKCRL